MLARVLAFAIVEIPQKKTIAILGNAMPATASGWLPLEGKLSALAD